MYVTFCGNWHFVDEQETVVVALVDTNTTRLFVTRNGFLEEVAGPDDDPFGIASATQAGSIRSATSATWSTGARRLHEKQLPRWRNW